MVSGSGPVPSFMKNKPKSEMLDFSIINLLLSMDDIAAEFVPNDKMVQFDKIHTRIRLYLRALMAGWEEFDWKRASDAGWLSEHDYTVFAEELGGLTAEQAYRDRGRGDVWDKLQARRAEKKE